MLFMISEVHPFSDGNGRISRIMMNVELTAAGQSEIIIPTVFRTDYLSALRQLTRKDNPGKLINAIQRVRLSAITSVETTSSRCATTWNAATASAEPSSLELCRAQAASTPVNAAAGDELGEWPQLFFL